MRGNRSLMEAADVDKESGPGAAVFDRSDRGGAPLEVDCVTVHGGEGEDETAVRLQQATLTLAAGEWLTVVGVNGSGKSTLSRLLAGLMPESMSGVVRRGFAGDGVSPIVLQQPRAQLFGETPREEVVFALEWRGVPAERISDVTEEALHRAGLAALADEPWERLSGGQQQMAAFAAATAYPSPLLVMDEATSMLDEDNRDVVMTRARELHADGTAVVWVTQRLDELGPDDRVVAVGEGRIIYDGRGREFLYGSADGDSGSVSGQADSGAIGPGTVGRLEAGAGGGEEVSDGGVWPLSPCLRAGLRLSYLMELALELRRLGKLRDPLPVTEREWQIVWGNAGK
ncbi:energy-coupling factor transport system ATP-binding protein [Cohnella sp. SGD-V74]|uniref:energy-coupling factor ABC transporter ATP-binding protein n=1 Tax=unclassified Cohnella TaxID=2636738 RepID=UPI000D489041|nr:MULTISPECIES: ABC transporter ATP-binding protein [unclassified Cohnella]PRX72552.1 energy-coupling factor transport system ATP-binding protein [Cohnella sp. SGD-V74]